MIIVQVGTNTGNDHVLQICKQQSFDSIFLIEPFAIHNESIHKHYRGVPNYKIDNIAIVPKSMATVELYYTENDGPLSHVNKSYEVTSIKPEHLLKHNYTYTSLRKFTVPAFTMNEYLTKYNLYKIDYLFLDIEGIDFEVLETIDFNKFDIRNLQIEHLHLDKHRLFEFMSSKGYSPTKGMDLCGYDTMFVKN
jgi:FkbM family methyltransferase